MFKQINVSKEHIRKGEKMQSRSCPIALACIEQWNTLVLISGNTAIVGDFRPAQRRTYTLPRSAKRFIRRFDNGLKVEPFNFRVAV